MNDPRPLDRSHHDCRIAEVLDRAEVLYVAVAARRGPHVTPAVFDNDAGRLWFVTTRRSVKARVIARNRRVGGLIELGGRAVMIGGRARIVDPLTARGIFSPDRLLGLPLTTVGYLSRNHRHATATVRDHEAPTLALSRVMVSIDIRRLALLDGGEVVGSWGRWPSSDLLLPGDPPTGHLPDLTAFPPGIRGLLADDAPVVLGWQSPAGPLALPARWQAGALETSGGAMLLAAAPSGSPASVCAERSRYRMNSKAGLLLTGHGHARRHGDGPTVRVTLDVRRTTWWKGEERRSVDAASV